MAHFYLPAWVSKRFLSLLTHLTFVKMLRNLKCAFTSRSLYFESTKWATFGFSGLGSHVPPTRNAKLQNAIITQEATIISCFLMQRFVEMRPYLDCLHVPPGFVRVIAVKWINEPCEQFSLVNKKQESFKPHMFKRNRKNACFVRS